MRVVNVQGLNADIDIGTEDLFPPGAAITFPAAVAATTVVSSSANDAAAGTGARTVRVKGLNANFDEIEETATLNGTGAVTLTNQYYRINSLEVLTAGSGLVNAGTIDVLHSATVLFRMVIGENRARTAGFTTSNACKAWAIKHFYFSNINAAAATVTGQIYTRKNGGLWQKRLEIAVSATVTSHSIAVNLPLDIGEDVRVVGTSTAVNASISGGVDIHGGSVSEVYN